MRVRLLLLIILILFFGFQLAIFSIPKSRFEQAKETVAKDPTDLEAHLILAEEFLKNNQFQKAQGELETILQSRASEETASRAAALWQYKEENNPADLKNLIAQWQKILEDKPDYRDGWLRLALYNLKLGKTDEAKAALENARTIDPNFTGTKDLEGFTKN
ncbi:hypothetical protein FJZ40_00370 [Candidatus Shapirobacteria bacterium]|nr:hypothetical protein [Candidatus Shapirobacteria bacterium]